MEYHLGHNLTICELKLTKQNRHFRSERRDEFFPGGGDPIDLTFKRKLNGTQHQIEHRNLIIKEMLSLQVVRRIEELTKWRWKKVLHNRIGFKRSSLHDQFSWSSRRIGNENDI